jgi:hypothetical protein
MTHRPTVQTDSMAAWAARSDADREACARMAQHFEAMHRPPRIAWWIIPAVILGGLGWAALITLWIAMLWGAK